MHTFAKTLVIFSKKMVKFSKQVAWFSKESGIKIVSFLQNSENAKRL